MIDILEKIYTEIWNGTDTALLMWLLFGFLIIILFSRRIGKIKELKNKTQLLLTIDFIFFPIIIVLFYFISVQIQKESAFILSLSLTLITSSWFLNRLLSLFYWDRKFVEQSGGKAPILLKNFVALIIYLLTISFILGFLFNKPITSILVSTGVIATIVGFAMKDFLADIINGISLSIERPYNIGDWIEFEDGSYLVEPSDVELIDKLNSL